MSLTDQQKFEKIKILEQKKKFQEELPHIYSFRDYKWSQEFLNSRNRICLLTAANQIGKSTIQLRKMITWATSPDLWPSLWLRRPRQFWLLYPTKDVAHLEYETKLKYLLPQGSMKDDPRYGWKESHDNKKISSIQFNTGILWVYKTYAQDVQNLQSGTCDYIGLDEEAPADIMGELFFRLSASQGYLSAVFTATQGQEYWRLAMEEKNNQYEKFPNADKWQISRFDCLKFADGTPSHWTEAMIKEDMARCQTEAEVQMRIFGKFVVAEGRTFPEFSIKKNVQQGGPVPKDWLVYAGIDYGSGGEKNHPAAICFVAVKPDFTKGRVIRAWRGDGIQTDASAIMLQYRAMKNEVLSLGLAIMATRYDQSARDLYTIGIRMGESIEAANKSHDVGIPIMNSLFKNEILDLDEEQDGAMKLAFELSNLLESTPKTRAKDDLADATRYTVSTIPWNWSLLNSRDKRPDTYEPLAKEKTENDLRREFVRGNIEKKDEFEEEFEEWNKMYES